MVNYLQKYELNYDCQIRAKLVGREINYIRDESVYEQNELLGSFIKLHYMDEGALPKEIIIPYHIEDESLLEQMLSMDFVLVRGVIA